MKLTVKQEELIALIPQAIIDSQNFSDATKLVLGQIDFMHGTDFAEMNGYIFCSDNKMSDETGVSVSQIKRVIKILANKQLITYKRGNRTKKGKESTLYWLTDLYYELANRPKPKNEPLIGGQNESEEKNEPLDIELEPDIKNTGKVDDDNSTSTGCTTENLANEYNIKKINDMENDKESQVDELPIINFSNYFDYDEIEIDREQEELEKQEFLQWMDDHKFQSEVNNDYVSEVFQWLQENLNDLAKKPTSYSFNKQLRIVNDYFNNLTKESFTDKQWNYIQGKMKYRDAIKEQKTKFFNEPGSFEQIQKRVDRLFNELDPFLDLLYNCWDIYMINSYSEDIDKLFDKGDMMISKGYMTPKQKTKFNVYINNFNKILRKKREILSPKKNTTSVEA